MSTRKQLNVAKTKVGSCRWTDGDAVKGQHPLQRARLSGRRRRCVNDVGETVGTSRGHHVLLLVDGKAMQGTRQFYKLGVSLFSCSSRAAHDLVLEFLHDFLRPVSGNRGPTLQGTPVEAWPSESWVLSQCILKFLLQAFARRWRMRCGTSIRVCSCLLGVEPAEDHCAILRVKACCILRRPASASRAGALPSLGHRE